MNQDALQYTSTHVLIFCRCPALTLRGQEGGRVDRRVGRREEGGVFPEGLKGGTHFNDLVRQWLQRSHLPMVEFVAESDR